MFILFIQVPHLAHKVGLKYNPLNNTLLLKFVKEYFDEIYLQPLIIVSNYLITNLYDIFYFK